MANVRMFLGLLSLITFGAAEPPIAINFESLSKSNPGPAFDHGFVGAWDLQGIHSLTLYDVDGRRMFDVLSFTLPDGTKTDAPISVAIDSDGTSALVYDAQNWTRLGIAILDKIGNQIRVIETEPYQPSQVCFAPDGSIWVFGELRSSPPTTDFMAFRHYSRDGRLLGSFVPRSALPKWEGAGLDAVLAPVIGLWRLRASKDRIGAVLLLGPSQEAWVELNLQGDLVGEWIYSYSQREGVSAAAFTSNGLLYGEHWIDGKRVGISVFDKSTNNWKPIPSLPAGHIIAADHERLVYETGDQLRWVKAYIALSIN